MPTVQFCSQNLTVGTIAIAFFLLLKKNYLLQTKTPTSSTHHQRAVSIGAEALLAQIFPQCSSLPKSKPASPVPGTPRSDAGSAIAHGPFASEVEKVPCPFRETFDWTDVRGMRKKKRPIRPPVEQNWHPDVTRVVDSPPLEFVPLLVRGATKSYMQRSNLK